MKLPTGGRFSPPSQVPLLLFSVLFIQAFSDDPDSFRYVSQPGGFAYLLNWVLGYFPWVLPISSFLATLVSLGFFSRNSELLALRALGKSSAGLAAPYLLLGLLVSSLSWFSKNWHDRWTNSGLRMSENPALSSFRMKIGQERIWHFTKFDEIFEFFFVLHIHGVPSAVFLCSMAHQHAINENSAFAPVAIQLTEENERRIRALFFF